MAQSESHENAFDESGSILRDVEPEFVLAQFADSDDSAADELRVEPPDEEARQHILAAEMDSAGKPGLSLQYEDAPAAERQPVRFSMLQLMAAMTFVATALALATWLPSSVLAGLSGIGVLLGIIFIGVFKPEVRGARLSRTCVLVLWVCGMLFYLTTAALALWRSIGGIEN